MALAHLLDDGPNLKSRKAGTASEFTESSPSELGTTGGFWGTTETRFRKVPSPFLTQDHRKNLGHFDHFTRY